MRYTFLSTSFVLYSALSAFAYPTLEERDGKPIFGPDGVPNRYDIGQHLPICGWLATAAAITTVSPNFMKNIFKYSGDISSVSDVTVTLYEIDTHKQYNVPVTWDMQAENNDNKNSVWWPGAIDAAAASAKLLPTDETGLLKPVGLVDALEVLTGMDATWKYKKDIGDNIWSKLQEAPTTPVVFQTLFEGCTTLVCGHAYAVLNATEANGVKSVGLYNPWGSDIVISIEQAEADLLLLGWLTDKSTLGGSGDETSEPKTTNNVVAVADPTTSVKEETNDHVVVVTEVVVVTKVVTGRSQPTETVALDARREKPPVPYPHKLSEDRNKERSVSTIKSGNTVLGARSEKRAKPPIPDSGVPTHLWL
ncbi:uncharacterized protein L203_102806 [Cryptococcus depauperatus CBS 7841]|uniref:Uncharacterized protein n=1 Tax=Cryptococcus depauperatus CBS 7841 TaxID=1295531 RepID=A0A1E3IAS8_9TREE|nr:hypothetical protein L203_04607 [Cryptococcus depauperatus CBS 7841]